MLLTFASLLFVGVTSTQTADAAPRKKPSLTSEEVIGNIAGTHQEVERHLQDHQVRCGEGQAGGQGHLHRHDRGRRRRRHRQEGCDRPGQQGAPTTPRAAGQDVQALATCPILNLSLGPLDLNLLGLVVHLDEVNLTSTRCRARATLLGNLLCAVAGLLDGPSLPGLNDIIADLLNLILGNLG